MPSLAVASAEGIIKFLKWNDKYYYIKKYQYDINIDNTYFNLYIIIN